MNRREDVKKVLAGQEPEYVPWFGDLAYWLNYLRDEDLIPMKYKQMGDERSREMTGKLAGGLSEEGLQCLHKDLGIGFYLQGDFPYRTIYQNVETEVIENSQGIITRYHTPYGTLQEIWKYVRESYSLAPVEYLLKTAEDIKIFRYIYENVKYEADYALAEKRAKLLEDNGINVMYTPKTPLMELVALKAGIENVVEIMADDTEEFEELLDCMKEKHTIAAQLAIDSPAECIFVPDNLSSEMVGGSLYDNYIKEVHEDWTNRIKAAGKKSMVHLDGTLNPLLRKLSEAGFDVIEAVTPKPVGDIELEELRNHTGENTIIWGGIPGGFFAESFPEEEFENWIIRVLKMMRKDRRFVLGVADEVVPGTSFSRLRKVEELIEKYGKFDRTSAEGE